MSGTSQTPTPFFENANLWRGIVSVFVMVSFIIVAVLALTKVISDSSVVDKLLDVLQNAVILVLGYWLGSSAGSTSKNGIIAGLATTTPDATPLPLPDGPDTPPVDPVVPAPPPAPVAATVAPAVTAPQAIPGPQPPASALYPDPTPAPPPAPPPSTPTMRMTAPPKAPPPSSTTP